MDNSQPDADLRLTTSAMDAAKALARSGDVAGARAAFAQMVHLDPENEDAWLWLAYVAESKEESLRYLEEASLLLPYSERIVEARQWAENRLGRKLGVEAEEDSDRVDPDVARVDPDVARAGRRLPRTRSARQRRRIPRAETPPAAEQAEGRSGEHWAQRVASGALKVAVSAATLADEETPPRPVAEQAQAVDRAKPAPPAHSDPLADLAEEKESPKGRIAQSQISTRLYSLVTPALSVLAFLAVVSFAWLGIVHARSSSGTAAALELPPQVVNPTSTPTVAQRIQPMWIQVDVAWTREDWDGVIEVLGRIREIDPENEEARHRLGEARYYRGLELIDNNQLEEARLELDHAVRLNASSRDLQQIRRDLKQYLLGLDAYWAQDWPRVVDTLQGVQRRRPDFRDTREMLGQAYYRVGMERQANEVWDEARDAYEAALDLLPDLEDADKRLTEVMDIIIPPSRIVVDLSDRLVTVYENHQPIRVFPACIGRPSAPTLPGRYLIQTKLPEAYASKWDLRMPWWLGIYWAGGSENGFHALPINRSTGHTLWRSALGTGCSFGCIVLDTPDALWLYKWAEMGTVVIVTP
jgi:tetratricopeptide (TPR) repeat protein